MAILFVCVCVFLGSGNQVGVARKQTVTKRSHSIGFKGRTQPKQQILSWTQHSVTSEAALAIMCLPAVPVCVRRKDKVVCSLQQQQKKIRLPSRFRALRRKISGAEKRREIQLKVKK